MKSACCLLLAALLALSASEDVAFKLKLVVDDGQVEKELKENIANVAKVNEGIGSSLGKLQAHADVVAIDKIQRCDEPADGVIAGSNLYKVNEVPQQDQLDIYQHNQTGCTYGALKARRGLDLSGKEDLKFDGTNTLVATFYVRGQEQLHINTWWSRFNHEDYDIAITDQGYEAKILEPNGVRRVLKVNAPGAIAPDYYEKYYITLDSEHLTFGRGCVEEPILKQKIFIRKGDTINIQFRTNSYYGVKFLYDCPLTEATIQHALLEDAVKDVAEWALKEGIKKGLKELGKYRKGLKSKEGYKNE